MNSEKYQIEVTAEAQYLRSEADTDHQQHIFVYTITIENKGLIPAKLLSRHWYITDGNGAVQEVKGEGVIGKQPRLSAGEKFKYASYAMIGTPVGSMHGSYQMIADDGHQFEAIISPFRLAIKSSVH